MKFGIRGLQQNLLVGQFNVASSRSNINRSLHEAHIEIRPLSKNTQAYKHGS
jgi:hypothetical protein